MKHIILGLLALTTSALTFAQELKVVLKNVKGEEGILWVALHKSEEDFLKTQFKFVKLSPVNGQVVAVFQDIVPGTYAISVMHDSNSNKELDKNSLGMPKEGFGFSNDAMGRFGPPEFKAASFVHSTSTELTINLKYW